MGNLVHKTLNKGFFSKLGLLVTAFGSAYLAYYFAGDSSKMINPIASILTWVLGIGLAVLAAYYSGHDKESKSYNPPMPVWEILALFFLFVFALLVRVIAIGKIPPALSGDEAGIGLFSIDILEGRFNNPFITGWYRFPSLFSMLPALTIALGGRTIEAIRIPSAIAGALTIVGIYGLGRVMFGRTTGWISAILLAGLSYHIQFSRLGLNNIWDGLFVVYILLLFWGGWYKRKRWCFIGTGVLLGLSQYFYVSGHVVPIIILIWLACMVFVEPQFFKQRLVDLLNMGVIAVVVFLPLGLHYIHYSNEFWEPMARVSAIPQIISDIQYDQFMGWFTLIWNFTKASLAFVTTPLISFYTLQRPLLPPLLAPLFIFGTGIVLFHLRDARYRLLLFWGILVIVINVLSVPSPAAHRFVIGMPLAVMVVSVGLMTIVNWGTNRWQAAKRYIYAVALLMTVIVVGMELQFYFVERGPIFGFYDNEVVVINDNSKTAMSLATYLEKYPDSTQVIFFGAPKMWYDGFPQLKYLDPQIHAYDVEVGAPPPELTTSSGAHVLYVFLPHRMAEADQIEQQYPGGVARWIHSEDNTLPLFFVYDISIP